MRGNYARIETVYRWSPCCRRRPVKGEELWLDPVEHSALASKVRKYESTTTFVLSYESTTYESTKVLSKVRKYFRKYSI